MKVTEISALISIRNHINDFLANSYSSVARDGSKAVENTLAREERKDLANAVVVLDKKIVKETLALSKQMSEQPKSIKTYTVSASDKDMEKFFDNMIAEDKKIIENTAVIATEDKKVAVIKDAKRK